MVASSVSPRVLSYAERAKKAQAIRSPIEVIPSKHSSSQPTITPTPTPSSSSLPPPPPPKSPSAPLPPPPSTPSTTAQPPVSPPADPKLTPPTELQPSPHKPAPVNVWHRRKEEFAARNASNNNKSAPPPLPPPPPPPQLSPSTSRSTTDVSSSSSTQENLSQNAGPSSVAEAKSKPSSSIVADDDDDPFIVRKARALRPQVPVPPPVLSKDTAEDWPQVGKSLPLSASVAAEGTKSEESRATTGDTTQSGTPRKGGAPKWIPLQLQAPAEVQPHPRKDPQTTRANRQSANTSRASSNHGQGRNSRNHSGRNSANQSRIHSNAASAQSSPRNPRNRKLPGEDPPPVPSTNGPTNRSSRTSSPLHVNPAQGTPPSFPPSDISNSQPSTYGNYLSPPQQGPSPYYPPQPPIPQVGSPVYHSPSHGPHLSLPPDQSLPMPPVHAYPYVYPGPYIPYDYIPPSAPYPYWNGGHHSHPGSGTHSPAYPASATPSSYAVALPVHIQQHFYPLPPMQQPLPSAQSHSQSHSQSSRNTTGSTSSERGSVEKVSPTSSPGAATSNVSSLVVDNAEITKINGGIRRSTSVVFGSIESEPSTAVSPSVSVEGELKDSSSIEKVFKSLAIGMDPADATTVPTTKSRKSAKGGKNIATTGEKEKEDHHHSNKVVNGEIALDPALAKEAEAGATGEMKWKFGNEGLASPPGGVVTELVDGTTVSNAEIIGSMYHRAPPVVDDGLGDDFKVKNFGYGFGGPGGGADAPKSDNDPTTTKERVEGEREGEVDGRPEATNYHVQSGPSNGRPRRGGYHNGGGYGYDRGGYGGGGAGRRGRGGMNGYGRGGYNRGYPRGNNQPHHHHNGNAYQRQGGPPPPPPPSQYNVTSPTTPYQGYPHMGGPTDPYYHHGAPPPTRGAPLATYIPTGFETYPPPPPSHVYPTTTSTAASSPSSTTGQGQHASPPLPVPMSHIGFSLDSVRFYLLGQLEYYLSSQNMAQDYFLRQRMDSRGWIEIGLLASFNRVKTLTADYQLVREVLMLSTMVQVREHHVRMGGWERFVLPDAPKSVVESEEDYSSYIPQNHHHHPTGISPANVHSSLPVAAMMGEGIEHHASGDAPQQWWNQNHLGGAEGEEEVEDDEEEDDVVFVMGPQDEGEGGMWSHERRT